MSTTSTAPRVGLALREARKAAGLSQEKLAQLADCSTAWIQVLEREPQDSPVLRRIWRVLDALGDRAGGGDA
jgi:transcriptional regulator with XRE-family HTH domain